MEGVEGPEHVEGGNKKIALLVAVLAAFLAISEMGAKGSQTHALTEHIEASNLWSFFQAKTIRQTTMQTAADAIEATYKEGGQAMPDGLKKQVGGHVREPRPGGSRVRSAGLPRADAASPVGIMWTTDLQVRS
jgi:hypothetical protein